MALNADDVVVGFSGGVYFAPAATALPTDATTALNVAYLELGYLTADGVTMSTDVTTAQIRAWQNGDMVREVQTAHDLRFQFAAMESNPTVLDVYFGNFATVSGAVEINGAQGTRGRWVVQILDGDTDMRIVIPDGQITERGDINIVNSDSVNFPFTVTAYPDPDYSGTEPAPAKAYLYTELGTP